MKVVLLKDVAGIGRKYDVKNVADGYALNFLIPRKLATAGTPQSIAHAERVASEQKSIENIQADLLRKNLKSLEETSLTISGKANEKGHLFAGLHKEAIVSELKKQKGIDILAEFIDLSHPIKEIGEHLISVKVHDKTTQFKLIIKAL